MSICSIYGIVSLSYSNPSKLDNEKEKAYEDAVPRGIREEAVERRDAEAAGGD